MKQDISGIYCIRNTVNNKLYIGSSYTIADRIKKHLTSLKSNKHINQHLQNAVNKYGINSFTIMILEECNKEFLLEKEQFYINSYPWETLYNLTKYSTGGGADLVSIEMYLLNLEGKIINHFLSGNQLAKHLGLSLLNYNRINTKGIHAKKYRVVTVEFYNSVEGLNIISSWPNYTNKSKNRIENNKLPKYCLTLNNELHNFNFMREVANFLNISTERVRQILSQEVKIHKPTGFTIDIIRKKS